MIDDLKVAELAHRLGPFCLERGLMVSAAESCTGGLIAAAITRVAGSSAWFDCGFVTYSNHAKMKMLGVGAPTIGAFGAVSEQTAREMALGALSNSAANIAFAVTGVAGPAGGTAEKPVGTVCFGFAWRGAVTTTTKRFLGSRDSVRAQSACYVFESLLAMPDGPNHLR